MKNYLFVLWVVLAAGITSCGKMPSQSGMDHTFSFSGDTLYFDTLFTSTESVTQSVKIINTTGSKLTLSEIGLAGGNVSPFRLNINGVPGAMLQNETIAAGDSIYVFVQVLIQPNDLNQPFFLEDSIGVTDGRTKKWIQLRAYGRNAFFVNNKTITKDTIWDSALPVVISGGLTIANGATLSIKEGTQIYIHAGTVFRVDGTLITNGSVLNPVVFTGDRLDRDYKDLPGSWPGLLFGVLSSGNRLRSTIIKNAIRGIVISGQSDVGNTKLTISQSVIQNHSDIGILATNTSLLMENSLVANCGINLKVIAGGDYDIINCDLAAYGNFYTDHLQPVLQMSNGTENQQTDSIFNLRANLINSIFWGDGGGVENEVVIDKQEGGGSSVFQVDMNHCMYKAQSEIANATLQNNFLNADPLFDSIDVRRTIFDFHITKHLESPALNNGITTGYLFDLDGKARPDHPDIGCYQN